MEVLRVSFCCVLRVNSGGERKVGLNEANLVEVVEAIAERETFNFRLEPTKIQSVRASRIVRES